MFLKSLFPVESPMKRFFHCLICTFAFGLIAHAFCYFNASFSHDSLYTLTSTHDVTWQLSIGRFLQPVYLVIRKYISAPWLLGSLSLLWISISAFLVVQLLEIRSGLRCVLVCGVLSTNLTIILLNATYISWVDIFMFSSLLAVLAVFLLRRYKYGFAFGALSIAVSLALYQSYLSVAVALLLMLFIKGIFEHQGGKTLALFAGKSAVMLLAGGALYWMGVRIVSEVRGIALSGSRNSIASVSSFSLRAMPGLIAETYKNILKFFFRADGYTLWYIVFANVVLALLAVLLLIFIIRRKKINRSGIILLLLTLLIMPFALNLTYFITKGFLHDLMIYAVFYVYIFVIFLWEYAVKLGAGKLPVKSFRYVKKGMATAILACITLIFFNNIVYANGAYLMKSLEYQSAVATMTRITDRIEQTEGYAPNETTVAFIGQIPKFRREGFGRYTATGLQYGTALTYYRTYEMFYRHVLGTPIKLLEEDDIKVLAKLQKVRDMPVFPDQDSIQMIDGVLVVKVRDTKK